MEFLLARVTTTFCGHVNVNICVYNLKNLILPLVMTILWIATITNLVCTNLQKSQLEIADTELFGLEIAQARPRERRQLHNIQHETF